MPPVKLGIPLYAMAVVPPDGVELDACVGDAAVDDATAVVHRPVGMSEALNASPASNIRPNQGTAAGNVNSAR